MSRQRTSAQWDLLRPTYRARLERKGITRQAYVSGANLSAARGHAATPEKPHLAQRNPQRYAAYIARKTNPTVEGTTDHIVNIVTRGYNNGEVLDFSSNGRDNEGKVDFSGYFIRDNIRHATMEELELMNLFSFRELQAAAQREALLKLAGEEYSRAFFYHAG